MGNQLRTPITSKVVETDGNGHFRAAVAAMNGFRESMEDAHCMRCTDHYGLFGVFDGHSGSQCSAFCAARIPKEIEGKPPPFPDEHLEAVTLAVDAAFLAKHSESGCTACYFVATPDADGNFLVQVANVGDSRIIVGRNGGVECISMTEDHKPSIPAEQERIERCGGTVSMDRVDGMLAMSRAMGDAEYKQGPGGALEQKVIAQPEVRRITCSPADWVVVACDGVFEGGFTNEEVVHFVRGAMQEHSEDLGKVACAVCDEALKRGSTDNITCMVVQFRDGTGTRLPRPLFIPGPYSGEKGNFRSAYRGMAERAELTMGQALEMRYDLIRAQMAQRILALKSNPTPAGPDEELKALQEELAQFKPGPLKLEGPARTAWFDKLAAAAPSEGEEDSRMALTPDMIAQFKQALASGNPGLANLLRVVGENEDERPGASASSSSPPPPGRDRKAKRKAGKGK